MYTLLYLKWIINKNLLYSTGNSAQCYMAAWMGGEFGGKWIHVYVWLSPFTVRLKLSQHGLSATPQYKMLLMLKKKLNKKEDGNWYPPFFTKECAILLSYPAPPSPSKTVHRSGTSHSSLGGPGLGVSTPLGSRLQSSCSQGPSHLSCFTPPEPHSCSWEW